jgi:hypothetical protein
MSDDNHSIIAFPEMAILDRKSYLMGVNDTPIPVRPGKMAKANKIMEDLARERENCGVKGQMVYLNYATLAFSGGCYPLVDSFDGVFGVMDGPLWNLVLDATMEGSLRIKMVIEVVRPVNGTGSAGPSGSG